MAFIFLDVAMEKSHCNENSCTVKFILIVSWRKNGAISVIGAKRLDIMGVGGSEVSQR